MRNLIITAAAVVALFPAITATAQDETTRPDETVLPVVEHEIEETDLIPPTSFKAYPFVFYTPETQLAFGGGASVAWRYPDLGPEQRPNSVLGAVTYTTRSQLIIALTPEIYTKNGTWLIAGFLGYKEYPDKFWGIGPDAPAEDEEDFEPFIFQFKVDGQRTLGGHFLGGPTYHLIDYRPHELDPDGQLVTGTVAGSEGSRSSGLGIMGSYDSREQRFSPLSGNLVELQWRFYDSILGSDYTFQELVLDLRHYQPLKTDWVLALQAYSHTLSGNPPFNMLAMLGGTERLRGYWTGRYRDRKAFVFQAELRLPVTRRFGAAAFAGAGMVGSTYGELRIADFKPSLGGGVRYLFDPETNLKLRLDLGFGEAGQKGVYVTIMEAF